MPYHEPPIDWTAYAEPCFNVSRPSPYCRRPLFALPCTTSPPFAISLIPWKPMRLSHRRQYAEAVTISTLEGAIRRFVLSGTGRRRNPPFPGRALCRCVRRPEGRKGLSGSANRLIQEVSGTYRSAGCRRSSSFRSRSGSGTPLPLGSGRGHEGVHEGWAWAGPADPPAA